MIQGLAKGLPVGPVDNSNNGSIKNVLRLEGRSVCPSCWEGRLAVCEEAVQKGKFARAERLLRRLVERLSSKGYSDRISTALCYILLGECSEGLNRFEESENFFRSALEVSQAPSVAALAAHQLARLLSNLGRAAEASVYGDFGSVAKEAEKEEAEESHRREVPPLESLGTYERELIKRASTNSMLFCRMNDGSGDYIKISRAYTDTPELRAAFVEAAKNLITSSLAKVVFSNPDMELYELTCAPTTARAHLSMAIEKLLAEAQENKRIYKIHSRDGEYIQTNGTQFQAPDDLRVTYLIACTQLIREERLRLIHESTDVSVFEYQPKRARRRLTVIGN